MNILAMDLAKNKSVACFYETQTHQARYQTVRTDRVELLKLLEGVGVDRLVIEVGSVSGWVHDLFEGKVAQIQVANPNGEAWQWKKVKVKTDRKDALKLAELSALGHLPTVHMPSAAVRQRRSFIVYRRKLIQRRTAIKNSIRAILLREGMHLASGKKGWTDESMAYLGRLAAPLEQVAAMDLWRGQLSQELASLALVEQQIDAAGSCLDELARQDPAMSVVTSIPGVGNRLGEAMVTTLDRPERFKSGRQVSSYVGLVPRKWQSGQMDRNGRITKAGSSTLRALLVEATWLALRWNPWLRAIYERTCRGQKKRKKVAIVAAARHLLVTAWAMLRDGTCWEQPRLSPPVAGTVAG